MALSDVTVRAEYNGNGSNTTFAIPGTLIEDTGSSSTEVKVYLRDTSTDPVTETLQTITTHYTLTGGPPVANVEFVTAPPSGTANVVIIRQLSLTHDANYAANTALDVEDVEDKFDRMTALCQQMQEQLDRCVKLDITSAITGLSMEDPTAERYLRVSSDGTRVESVVGSGEINPPVSSTDNAVVRWDGTAATAVQDSGVTIDDSDNVDIPGNLQVDGNTTITGNLTVDGTTTTVNTATIDLEDPNITINNGQNQAAADTIAGITVEMSDATDVGLTYDNSSATKWKAGEVGSEVDLVGTSSTQTLTNKTLTSPVLNTGVSGTAVLDEDDMSSNSATQLATQQSIKAYSDSGTQTLTNKTIDGDNNTISNLAHGAEVDNPSSGVHGVTGSVVGTTDAQTLTNKTLTSPVLNTGVSGTAVLDEDNMASNSATQLATQQSIKAYVDTQFAVSLALPSEVFTGTDTLDANNALALCDTSSAAFTLNLPAATGSNKRYWIQYTDSGFANALTVEPDGAETIGGAANTTLNTQGETIEIVDAASGAWTILRRDIPSKLVSYTPTGSFTTNTTYTGFWKRVGDEAEIQIELEFAAGAPNSTTLNTISLPSGFSIDTGKLSFGTSKEGRIGSCDFSNAGTSYFPGWVVLDASTANTVRPFSITSDSAAAPTYASNVTQAFPFTFGSGDRITMNFKVPISGWNG